MRIDQLAAAVGLTTRTIRTYQARGLLPPPGRLGRTPYYGAEHLARLRLVMRLQRQGLSLDGIRALLEPDLVLGQLLVPYRQIAFALRADYALTEALLACRVLVKLPDGSIRIHKARAILASGAGNSPGKSTKAQLWALVDAVAEILPSVETVLERLQRIMRVRLPDSDARPEQLSELAVEVLRLCLEAHMEERGPEGREAGEAPMG